MNLETKYTFITHRTHAEEMKFTKIQFLKITKENFQMTVYLKNYLDEDYSEVTLSN